MGERNWFSIVYVKDSERKKITLFKARDYRSGDAVNEDEPELASRRKFEWWTYTPEEIAQDANIVDSFNEKYRQENLAADYARELAKKHNLVFIGQSKTDGILD